MNVDDLRPLADTVSRADEETRQQVFRAWDEAGACGVEEDYR